MDYKEIYQQQQFKNLEKKYQFKFDDKELLVKAFIHPSLYPETNQNYQRLEFLGDAVLQLIISDYMYRFQSERKEGEMSKERAILVSESSLALVVKKEKIANYLQLGKSILQEKNKLSNSYIADIYESFIAAIYLDRGYKEASKFVNTTLINRIDDLLSKDFSNDYKTALQEKLQINGTIDLVYHTDKKSDGFNAKVYLDEALIGQGKGSTKKTAEQQAAKRALKALVE